MGIVTKEESPRWLVGMTFEWIGRIWLWGFGVTLFSLPRRPGNSEMPHPGKPWSLEFQEEGFRLLTS